MEDMASRIVDKAISLGCQDAVADVVTNRSYQIRFARNEPVISNRWRENTASVFFVYQKRVLASDIKDLSRVDDAVERLVKIAKGSQETAKAGHKAGRIAALARSPKPVKPGRYTIVFDPLTFGSVSDQIGGRLGAYAVLAGL